MEHMGMWGLIPPLLTIVLAFVTKDVVVSLFLGILSGTLIAAGGNPMLAVLNLTDGLANSLADGWNIRIFMFCALLGGLVGLLSKTGAAGSFGHWASAKLKKNTGSQFMTFIFGIIIFIDDYFNSLTVGTVMRPVTDKTNTSRAKLAYILDSTAAPICIIAPISSWVITVMSIVRSSDGFEGLGISEFEFFIRSIAFNLYALLALMLVLAVIFLKIDFPAMRESEILAKKGVLYNEEKYGPVSGNVEEIVETKANAVDMLVPIILLIISAVVMFPLTTWIGSIDGESITTLSQAMAAVSLSEAFNNTDASQALMYSIIITLLITYIYYLARGLMSLKESGEALRDGIKSMVPALLILSMAWTVGGVIKSSPADGGLGLGLYLSEIVVGGNFPLFLIPAIVFILSALIAFATGTSWGTFAIMIPIVMPIVIGLSDSNAFDASQTLNAAMICISAVLGGAVFGDHASPISDTTILSSTGASCPHLEHVATQMPYAVFIAVCSFVGFIFGGLFMSAPIAWLAALIVFVGGLVALPQIEKKMGFK